MPDAGVVLVEDRVRIDVHHARSWYNGGRVARILRVVFILLLTAFFVAFFLWKSNLHEVWRIILATNAAWFALGLVVNGSALIFRTIRWRVLLSTSDPPPFYPTFFATTLGYM